MAKTTTQARLDARVNHQVAVQIIGEETPLILTGQQREPRHPESVSRDNEEACPRGAFRLLLLQSAP